MLGSFAGLLVTTPFPIRNDFQQPLNPVRLAKVEPLHTNINIFTNPIPFFPTDYNKPKKPLPGKDQIYPTLVANFSRPFIPYDQSVYRQQTPRAPDQIYPNLPLNYGRPFIPVDYSRPHPVYPSRVPVMVGFQILITPPDIGDKHDGGVFVKKRKKRSGPGPLDYELEEKTRRRAAIELAVYGPEVEYQPPPAPFVMPPAPPPDVTGLAQTIAALQREQQQASIAQQGEDEETELEAILREIL